MRYIVLFFCILTSIAALAQQDGIISIEYSTDSMVVESQKEWNINESLKSKSLINYSDKTLKECLKQSQKSKKFVLVYFSAPWCIPCKKMDYYTFSDLVLSEEINNNYISLKLNAEYFDALDIAEFYEVKEYPTFLVLDFKGNVIRRFKGFFLPEYFLKELRG